MFAYKVGFVIEVRIDSCECICEFCYHFFEGYNTKSVVIFGIASIATTLEYQSEEINASCGDNVIVGAQPQGVGGDTHDSRGPKNSGVVDGTIRRFMEGV